MTKFTKAQLKEIEGVCDGVNGAFTDLQTACDVYNDAPLDKKDEAKAAVEQTITEYNEQLSRMRGVCEDLAVEIRDFIDGKSEKWQESEKCSAYEAWAEEWEADLEDVSWDRMEQKDSTTGIITLCYNDLEDYGETVSGYSTEVQS